LVVTSILAEEGPQPKVKTSDALTGSTLSESSMFTVREVPVGTVVSNGVRELEARLMAPPPTLHWARQDDCTVTVPLSSRVFFVFTEVTAWADEVMATTGAEESCERTNTVIELERVRAES